MKQPEPRKQIVRVRSFVTPILGSQLWQIGAVVEWPTRITDPKIADAQAEQLGRLISALLRKALKMKVVE